MTLSYNKNTKHKIIIQHPITSNQVIEKKMVVQTKPGNWIGTTESAVVPFSIHSAIYDGIAGDFKIKAFLNIIKANVKGKIMIVMCEGAHLNTISLQHESISQALKKVRQDSEILYNRFKDSFEGCEVVSWESFIKNNKFYNLYLQEINHFVDSHKNISNSIYDFLEQSYQDKIRENYLDKQKYIEKSTLDLIEMATGVRIMYESGCKFLFYPGATPKAIDFFHPVYFPDLVFVNVGIKRNSKSTAENY